MIRAAATALLLAITTAGCDAGMNWRTRIEVEDARGPAAGVPLRTFWFDRYAQNPLEMGVEEARAAAAADRSSRPAWGITQKKWKEVTTDETGRAEVGLETFYAGALFLPLHDLLMGQRENDPAGFWIQAPEADWIVLPTEEGHALFLVRRFDGGAEVLGPGGSIEGWLIRVRLPSPSGPAR